jgi:hypothetical protein
MLLDLIYDEKDKNFKFLEVNSLVSWQAFSQSIGINMGQEIIHHCIDLHKRQTKKLENVIQDYYDNNYEHLYHKKFHYASRLYLYLKKNVIKNFY